MLRVTLLVDATAPQSVLGGKLATGSARGLVATYTTLRAGWSAIGAMHQGRQHREVRGDWGDTKSVRCDELAEQWNLLPSHTHHQASRKDESTTYTTILLIAARSAAAVVCVGGEVPKRNTCYVCCLLLFEVVLIQ